MPQIDHADFLTITIPVSTGGSVSSTTADRLPEDFRAISEHEAGERVESPVPVSLSDEVEQLARTFMLYEELLAYMQRSSEQNHPYIHDLLEQSLNEQHEELNARERGLCCAESPEVYAWLPHNFITHTNSNLTLVEDRVCCYVIFYAASIAASLAALNGVPPACLGTGAVGYGLTGGSIVCADTAVISFFNYLNALCCDGFDLQRTQNRDTRQILRQRQQITHQFFNRSMHAESDMRMSIDDGRLSSSEALDELNDDASVSQPLLGPVALRMGIN